jgi:DNA-binding LacI/PurR family transcriptional regulator
LIHSPKIAALASPRAAPNDLAIVGFDAVSCVQRLQPSLIAVSVAIFKQGDT